MFRRLVINPVRRKLGLPVHYVMKAPTIYLGAQLHSLTWTGAILSWAQLWADFKRDFKTAMDEARKTKE